MFKFYNFVTNKVYNPLITQKFNTIFNNVNKNEAIIIERFGKYNRTLMNRPSFAIPFFEQIKKVSLVETPINIKPIRAITKDNIPITVNSTLFLKISNPFLACYSFYPSLFGFCSIFNPNKINNVILSIDHTIIKNIAHLNHNQLYCNTDYEHFIKKINDDINLYTFLWGESRFVINSFSKYDK